MAFPTLLELEGSSAVPVRSSTLGSTPSMDKALRVSGGAAQPAPGGAGQSGFGLRSAWGVLSVVFILMNALKRLAPIAAQPFQNVSLDFCGKTLFVGMMRDMDHIAVP